MSYVRVTDANGDPIVFAAYRENWLDNGWFTINQLGTASVTASSGSGVKFIDRWSVARYSSGSQVFQWSDDGITITPTATSFLDQYYSQPLTDGDSVTVGMLMSDGTFYSRATTVGAGLVNLNGSYIRVRVNDTYMRIQFTSTWTGGTIRAIKLERGRPSTLQGDDKPCYATELLKCQRFRYVIDGSTQYRIVGSAYPTGTAGAYRLLVPLPTPLAKTPTVSLNSGTQSNLRLAINGSYTDSSAMSVDSTYSNNMAAILNVTFGTATGVGGYAYIRNSDKLIIDAETYS